MKEGERMFTKYTLIVIWDDNFKEEYDYQTYEDAQKHMEGFKKAFGNQISWCGIKERRW